VPRPALATDPVELDVLLVGCGGVANGWVYTMRRAPAAGRVEAVDYQALRPENLGAYVCATRSRLKRPKAQVIKEELEPAHAQLAAIRRLLLDETLAPGDRIAGCLVTLYGQQASTIAALRTADISCDGDAVRLKLGADWLDVPEPVATLLRQHLHNRSNMTTAANPASSWLFPGQFAGEHRSYRRLVRVLHQLGIPARASRLAAWRELTRQAPPAVLADALGVSPGTAIRHAFLGGADWSAYALPPRTTRRRSRRSRLLAAMLVV
jgi:hypothetical protein